MWIFLFIFLFGAFLLFASYIWNLLKTILTTLGWTVAQIWKHYKVDVPMQKNGFLEKKKLEERMIAAERELRYKNQVLEEQNKIVTAGLRKVRELRAKYTYADEYLFGLLLRKFPVMSISEIEQMEDEIKASHISNELINSIDTIPNKSYTLADINGLEPLEEDREDPIVVRIYKN